MTTTKQANPKRRRRRARRRNASGGKIAVVVLGVAAATLATGYGILRYRERKNAAAGKIGGTTLEPPKPGQGLEGGGAPFVGSGWSWPEQNVFPSEASFLGLLQQAGYSVSGTSVLSTKNKAAVKKFQSDWNLYIANVAPGEPFSMVPAEYPAHLTVDGLIGPATVRAMSAVHGAITGYASNGRDFIQETWRRYTVPHIVPAFVLLLDQLGYITQAQWASASASTKKATIKKFQRDYNCAISTVDMGADRTVIAEDGLAGPKTTEALDFAQTQTHAGDDWQTFLGNAGCQH